MKNNKTNKETMSTNELSNPLDTANNDHITSDIDGSYTGHPIDGGKPVQDADDL